MFDIQNSFICSEVRLFHAWNVLMVVFSPDREYLAFGCSDFTIGVWKVSSGEGIKGHVLGVWSLVFSPDREYLTSRSEDRTIGVWSVSSGKRIKTLIVHNIIVRRIVFSPNGKYLGLGIGLLEYGGYRAGSVSKPSQAIKT